MELSKKTTILFSPELHRRLTSLAEKRHASLGKLVREACEANYGIAGSPERTEAVRALAAMRLPVGTPSSMKQESQPDPGDILP